MATTAPIQDERRLLDQLGQALEALGRTTGLDARLVALEPTLRHGHRGDALIEIHVDRKRHRYVVEAKKKVDRLAPIGHLKAMFDRLDERGVLFAPYITTAIANQCRKLDVAFFDTVGNTYFRMPGLYIFITGEKPDHPTTIATATQGAGTATALRIIFALLCKRDLLNAPYRDIVEAANVALGAVGWVFFDLEKRAHVVGRQRKHDRRFLDPVRLFEEWATNYPIKLRPKLNARRLRAEDPTWWQAANLAEIGAYWGGEVAAEHLTHHLKPENLTIYIDPDKDRRVLTRLVTTHRLRADPTGNIEVLDAFWKLPPDPVHPDVVPPILAYADLVATLDPRNLEAAKLIRERYIDNALRQA